MAGLPKAIIKKYGVSKKAWEVYMGQTGRTKQRKVNMSRKRHIPSVKTTMARKRRIRRAISRSYPARRYRRFRRGKSPMPVLPLVGIGYAMSAPVQQAINGNFSGALAELGARFTGYNFESKQFDLMYSLYNGYLPIIAGVVGSKVMTAVGANRMIRKIPMVGKFIKL